MLDKLAQSAAWLDGSKVVLSVPRGKFCQVFGFEGGVIGVRQNMSFDLAAFDFGNEASVVFGKQLVFQTT